MSFDPRINSFRIRQYTLLLGEMTNDVHCLALNACIKFFLNQVHESKYKLYIYFFFLHSKKKRYIFQDVLRYLSTCSVAVMRRR